MISWKSISFDSHEVEQLRCRGCKMAGILLDTLLCRIMLVSQSILIPIRLELRAETFHDGCASTLAAL